MIKKMKNEEYFSIPYYSASYINQYITNPSLAGKLGEIEIEKDQTSAKLYGSILHKSLLEKDEFEMNQEIYMSMLRPKEQKTFSKNLDSIKSNNLAVQLLKSSMTETVFTFTESFEKGNLKGKAKIDSYNVRDKVLCEIKTTGCKLEDFPQQMEKYNYLNQMAFYLTALQFNQIKVDMCAFIAVETIKPFDCHVFLIPKNNLIPYQDEMKRYMQEIHWNRKKRFDKPYTILEA